MIGQMIGQMLGKMIGKILSTTTRKRSARKSRLLVALSGAALLAAGCEEVPDHCEGYVLACLSVTVQSGPAEVRRVRVFVDDGLDTSTVLTPKKEPKMPLAYPLRFAIRFGEFDNLFKGDLTLHTSALNSDFDILGETETKLSIKEREKKAVTIDIGPPIPTPDLAEPPPDLAAHPDLSTNPDMP